MMQFKNLFNIDIHYMDSCLNTMKRIAIIIVISVYIKEIGM